MLKKFIKKIEDRWLAWSTGLTDEQLAVFKFKEQNTCYGAQTVSDKFKNFKHIIPVDYYKVYSFDGIVLCCSVDVNQFIFPNRLLEDSTWFTIERGDWRNNDFYFDELFGGEQAFAITNNDRDATIIALKYS